MSVKTSVEYLQNLERDLAAEADPALRAWYGQEMMLQPEYKEAVVATELLSTLAGHIGELARRKASDDEIKYPVADSYIEPDDTEYVRPPTQQEILMGKIIKKYDSILETYRIEVKNIDAPNKSKRELKLKLARRNFAKQFTDIRDISGDEHLVLQSSILAWATFDLIEDKELQQEVVDNCVSYAENNGAKITADPERLATIISFSIPHEGEEPLSASAKRDMELYDNILKAIFSSTNNAKDFSDININLALASFDLLANRESVKKASDIFTLQLPYMRSSYMYAIFKGVLKRATEVGDVYLTDEYQAMLSMGMLTQTYLGADNKHNPKIGDAQNRIHSDLEVFHKNCELQGVSPPKNLDLVFKPETKNNDPVVIKRIGQDTFIPFHQAESLTPQDERVLESKLFNQRMKELAPYIYAIAVAKERLGTGVHTLLLPISPSITVEAFIPQSAFGIGTRDSILTELNNQVNVMIKEILEVGVHAEREGIGHFTKDRKLQMGYMLLYPGHPSKGCIIFRPGISHDKNVIPPIQFLTVNHHRAVPGFYSNDTKNTYTGPLLEENETLRREIGLTKKRFLGRRPIRATMPSEINATGLKAINLRTDATGIVHADFELDDGEATLKFDRNLRLVSDEEYGVNNHYFSGAKSYYENLILKVAKFWSCSQEISTSEGVVSEITGNGANMGHYAYLRIRNGRRYNFSESQRKHCRDEQGLDLAVESQRLKALDQSGQSRNSTYVREQYDPNKPPLEFNYSAQQ